MTLVLTGLANGFRVEATRTVDSLGLDGFLVKTGATGPFLGSSAFPATKLQVPGVEIAVPLVYGSASMPWTARLEASMCSAHREGPGHAGHGKRPAPVEPHEAAVSSTLRKAIGTTIEVGSRNLQVVGIVDDSTALAGQPNIFLTVSGAQKLLFSGQSLISSIGVKSMPERAPSGFWVGQSGGAIDDLLRTKRRPQGHDTDGGVVVGGGRAHRQVDDLHVRAGTHPRLRGLQGGRRTDGLHPCRAGDAGSHCGRIGGSVGRGSFSAPRATVPDAGGYPQIAFLLLPVVAVTIGVLASLPGCAAPSPSILP